MMIGRHINDENGQIRAVQILSPILAEIRSVVSTFLYSNLCEDRPVWKGVKFLVGIYVLKAKFKQKYRRKKYVC
jgi:hypothetical protein